MMTSSNKLGVIYEDSPSSSSSQGGMKRSESSMSLHTIREVSVQKPQGGFFGAEFTRIGKNVFITVVRPIEVEPMVMSITGNRGGRSTTNYTPAYRAGLSFGDEILRINGIDVHSLSVPDIYKEVAKATEVNIEFREQSHQSSYFLDFASLKPTSTNLGMLVCDGEIVDIGPGTVASAAGIPIGTSVMSVAGKSAFGMDEKELVSTILKHAKTQPAGTAIEISVTSFKIYSSLLPAMRQAMQDFSLHCPPYFYIDHLNSDDVVNSSPTISYYGQNNNPLVPKLTKTSYEIRDTRKRGTSLSRYLEVVPPRERLE